MLAFPRTLGHTDWTMPSSFEARSGARTTAQTAVHTLIFVLSAFACARPAEAPPSPAAASTVPAASASTAASEPALVGSSGASPAGSDALAAPLRPHLTLAALALKNENGQSVLLDANGVLSVSGKAAPVGTLLPDGRFVAPDGSLKARMTEGGEFFSADGRRMPVSVAPNGTVHIENGGQTLSFDASGTLVGGSPNAPKTSIEGLTEPTRRTAAFLLILAAFPARN